MPLYGYICGECNHEFDEFSSIANRTLPTKQPCPSCGAMEVKQALNIAPIADPVRLGRIKAPEGFRDVLRNVKKNTYGNKMTID